ncbi:MAG: 50S ribosomal protein L23 [Gammaproteobacteria bacterium]
MISDRPYNIIIGPRISEKSAKIGEYKNRQIIFKVVPNASKAEIKRSVEALFNVKVSSVQVARMKPKTRGHGRIKGKTNAWKKAYVSLKEGFDIDFTTGVE